MDGSQIIQDFRLHFIQAHIDGRVVAGFLCLVAVWFGGCKSAGEHRREKEKSTMNVKRTTEWTNQKVVLYSITGAKRQLDARRASYEIPRAASSRLPGNRDPEWVPWRAPVIVAFVEPADGLVYLGEECDFYIQGDSSVVGVACGSAEIMFRDSFVERLQPSEGIERAVAYFERETDGDKWLQREIPEPGSSSTVSLGWVFGPHNYFTADRPGSSGPGRVSLVKYGVKDGTIELHLKNQTGELTGILWIDIATHKPVRATLNGEQVLPRPPGWPVEWKEGLPFPPRRDGTNP